MEKEELLMLTYGKYRPEDYPKTIHGQKELILHIDEDPVNPEDGHCAYLALDQTVWMTTHRGEQMDMHNAVNLCPDNARVFVAGLGLGLILLYLARAGKTQEVIVAEINPYVVKIIEPRLRFWFSEHYPDFNWHVVLGDAEIEARNQGKFDWFFWDIWPVANFKKKASDKFAEISQTHLIKGGIITTWHDLAKIRRDMKNGYDFKSYLHYTLVGNMNQDNLRIRGPRNLIEEEKAYWDDRYARGGTSGQYFNSAWLSVAKKRNELLWAAIEQEIPELDHIVDVGCGDLRIWGDRDCQDYVGIDISMQILQRNKKKRPHWNFICSPAEEFIPPLTRENVFCFNMIYHILDPENVRKILYNLCRYATKRIFIYTWIVNPLRGQKATDGKYQMYHPMKKYLSLFNEMGFSLTSMEFILMPSALYIFKRSTSSYSL